MKRKESPFQAIPGRGFLHFVTSHCDPFDLGIGRGLELRRQVFRGKLSDAKTCAKTDMYIYLEFVRFSQD